MNGVVSTHITDMIARAVSLDVLERQLGRKPAGDENHASKQNLASVLQYSCTWSDGFARKPQRARYNAVSNTDLRTCSWLLGLVV